MWSGSSRRGPRLRIAWGVLRNSGGLVTEAWVRYGSSAQVMRGRLRRVGQDGDIIAGAHPDDAALGLADPVGAFTEPSHAHGHRQLAEQLLPDLRQRDRAVAGLPLRNRDGSAAGCLAQREAVSGFALESA